MKELNEQTQILEPTIQVNPRDLVEKILQLKPQIIGLGVYIWNAQQSLEIVSLLKKIAPEIPIVLGGPEVSFESEKQEIVQKADYLIQGEGDLQFYNLCKILLEGQKPERKIFAPLLPNIQEIALPYELFSEDDIINRIIYVEASRGCPYKCEYCLSSLDKQVRSFDLSLFLHEIQKLIDRGARTFKFVDRTFNLSPTTSVKILDFFYQRVHLGLFLHFEMVPDRLPDELKDLIRKFPEGSLQFEIGIQTWNTEVATLVSRKNDFSKVRENIRFLVSETKVHIHADLIAGLPGESLESFGLGFDALAELAPHEIQVGILKRLKGTPIIRHDEKWQMIYSEQQPFQILKTKMMSFEDLQFMNRFAKFWDHYANSGQFTESLRWLKKTNASPFLAFSEFTSFLSNRFATTYNISLESLAEALWVYLSQIKALPNEEVQNSLIQDYCYRVKRRDIPHFLKQTKVYSELKKESSLQRRQNAHQGHQKEPTS